MKPDEDHLAVDRLVDDFLRVCPVAHRRIVSRSVQGSGHCVCDPPTGGDAGTGGRRRRRVDRGADRSVLLRDAGWDVDVFERSAVLLEGRGGGIVAHPTTMRYLVERAGLALADVSAAATWLRYLDPEGGVAHEEPCSYRFTSYDALYRPLLERFGQARYHLAEEGIALDETTLVLASGRRATADLGLRRRNQLGRGGGSSRPRPSPSSPATSRGAAPSPPTASAQQPPGRPRRDHVLRPAPTATRSATRSGDSLQNWLWYWNLFAPRSDLDDLTWQARLGEPRPPSSPGLVPAGMSRSSSAGRKRLPGGDGRGHRADAGSRTSRSSSTSSPSAWRRAGPA